MQSIDTALEKLQKSDFRRKFKLSQNDIDYINQKGIDTVRKHAEDFIKTRLAPADIPNDGKQTPMRGHPVFVAQHGCACCCRGCLYKWYKVKPGTEMSDEQQEKVVSLLMRWIEKQMENGK